MSLRVSKADLPAELSQSLIERFGVSPPAGGDQARQAEIYRVEAGLREHGLDVREAAVR